MERSDVGSKVLTYAWGCTTLLYVGAVVYSILVEQPFFSDGGHFFLRILEYKSVMDPGNIPRIWGHYFTEIPILSVLKFTSIKDVSILSYFFSSGFYLAQAFCLLVCFGIARKTNQNYMLFAVMGIIGISGNAMFLTVQDALLMSYLFWPLLFYLTLMEEYTPFHAIMAVGIALISTRTYESAMLNNPVLLTVLGVIAVKGWKGATHLTKVTWIVIGGFLAAGIYVAVDSVLNPIYHGNQANFLKSIQSVVQNPQVLFTTVSLVLLCIHLIRNDDRLYKGSILFLGVTGLLIGLLPLLLPSLAPPWHHYYARSYVVYVLPVFGLIVFYVMRFKKNITSMQWKRASSVCLILATVQLVCHISMTFKWQCFRTVFIEELVTHQGPINFEDARISNHLLNPLSWDWTNPTMSIIWSPNHYVTTVIANPVNSKRSWEPIKVLDLDTFPKLAEYGFSYKKYKESIAALPLLPIYSVGWSVAEGNHRWSIASHAEISIINNSTVPQLVSVEFISATIKHRNIEISINGKHLQNLSLGNNGPFGHFKQNSIMLVPGTNTLTIQTDIPAELPGNGDPRKLSFGISNLRISRE
jgi:hypothetical protein